MDQVSQLVVTFSAGVTVGIGVTWFVVYRAVKRMRD